MKKYIVVAAISALAIALPVSASTPTKPIATSKQVLGQITSKPAITTSTAYLRSDISIIINGQKANFKSASGEAIYPLLYQNSTYLPLRAIGEVMNKNVNWDEATKTVTLDGKRENTSSNKENPVFSVKKVDIQERPDFTIIVDGIAQTFKTPSGQKIYPILYNGSTYLPLRAIGNIMGSEVLWDDINNVVTLKTSTVTDADSFTPNEGVTAEITTEKAKEIALDDSGKSATEVTFVKAERDFENGKFVYDIEFYSGNTEYDYEIDAQNGKIIKKDVDIEDFVIPKPDTKPNDIITTEKAKEIALNHAGVSPSKVTTIKAKLDYDDGRQKYDVKFRVDKTEYEYEIDAQNGSVLEHDMDFDD